MGGIISLSEILCLHPTLYCHQNNGPATHLCHTMKLTTHAPLDSTPIIIANTEQTSNLKKTDAHYYPCFRATSMFTPVSRMHSTFCAKFTCHTWLCINNSTVSRSIKDTHFVPKIISTTYAEYCTIYDSKSPWKSVRQDVILLCPPFCWIGFHLTNLLCGLYGLTEWMFGPSLCSQTREMWGCGTVADDGYGSFNEKQCKWKPHLPCTNDLEL